MTGTPDAAEVMREMHKSCKRWVCPHCQGELVFHNMGVWEAGYKAGAGYVRAARAEAWDEGADVDAWEEGPAGQNPYRDSEPTDEFQDSED